MIDISEVLGSEPGSSLGVRLREMRTRAGLSQAEVARRMGHAHPGYRSLVNRLELGKVKRPSLAVLGRFVRACGAELAELGDALPDAVPVRARKRRRPAGREERIRRARARARTIGRERVIEDRLYGWLDDEQAVPKVAHRVLLASFGRRVFDNLVRARDANNRALEELGAQGVSREDAEGIRGLVEKQFREMDEQGALDRPTQVDAAAVADGRQKLPKVARAATRLRQRHEWRFNKWFENRGYVIERIRQESRALHDGLGLRDRDKRSWLNAVTDFCIIADEAAAGSDERGRRFEARVGQSDEPDLMRAIGEFAVRRFDELKPQIPKKPNMS